LKRESEKKTTDFLWIPLKELEKGREEKCHWYVYVCFVYVRVCLFYVRFCLLKRESEKKNH